MQPSRRNCLLALLALLVFPLLFAPRAHAATLTITSSPPGATVEIDGVIVGTTPFHMKVPGGYFHKTRTVFGQTLQHEMTLRIYKDGYTAQDLRLTEGPFEWVAMDGRRQGHYWLLKANHIEATLEPASMAFTGRVKRTDSARERSECGSRADDTGNRRECNSSGGAAQQSGRMGNGFPDNGYRRDRDESARGRGPEFHDGSLVKRDAVAGKGDLHKPCRRPRCRACEGGGKRFPLSAACG